MNRLSTFPTTFRMLLLIALLMGQKQINAQIFWQEDFSSYPNGTQNSALWSTSFNDCDDGSVNSGDNYWGVFNGEFRVNDIEGFNCTDEGSGPGGNNQNTFTTVSIDISAYACVRASVSLSSTGTFECNFLGGPSSDPVGAYNGHDQMTIEYSVDGGGWIPFATNGYICGDNGLPATALQDMIVGNAIQIRITAGNQANGENYYFDDITLENVSTTPTLSAIGPFCENDGAVNLSTVQDGVSGNWSGPGVVLNSFSPSGAGTGTWTLTFNPFGGQCANQNTTDVTVNAASTPSLGTIGPFCETDASVTLNTTQSSITGTWSGTGVSGNTFDPSVGAGNHTLTFTPTAGQCANTATTNVNVTAAPVASATSANACENAVGSGQATFDLTQLDMSVSGGSGSVTYYTSPTAMTGTEINTPTSYTSLAGTVYAVVQVGGCTSAPADVDLTVVSQPDIMLTTTSVNECGDYTLSTISGTNLTGSEAYYTGSGGTGASFSAGDMITTSTTLFIYDSAAPGCSDEESLSITITPEPDITPLANASECGSYTLPAITGTNLTGGESYYTGSNGSGTSFAPGQTITSNTSLFIYDSAGAGCEDEESFSITITPAPDVDPLANVSECGSYTLPAITGTNLTGGESYYSGSNGSGASFTPGQTLTSSTSLFIYDSAGAGCEDEESFSITITPAPDVDPLANVSECGSYTLPAITGTNLTGGESYYTGSSGSGTPFTPGQTITSSTSLFIYDSAGAGCEDEENLSITITPAPDVNPIADASNCASYTLPAITGTNLTGGQAYFTGPNGTGTSFAPGQNITTSTSLFIYDSGGASCEDEENFNITITPEPDISPIADVDQCGSYTFGTINGTNLSGTEAYFTGPNGTGSVFIPGQSVTNSGTYFIYDDAGAGCSDQEQFQINIALPPDVAPMVDVAECNTYTLPGIMGTNLTGNEAYYTGANGGGEALLPGQLVDFSTTLFIYDDAGSGCMDQESFLVTILPPPSIDPIADASNCNSYTLPAITGSNFFNTPGYYTGPAQTGIQFNEGDAVTASITLFAYSGTPGCEDEEAFDVTILPEPEIDAMTDVVTCNEHTFAAITGTNFTSPPAYYTGPDRTGVQFNEGDVTSTSGTYYAYIGEPGCDDEEEFEISIQSNPDIDAIGDQEVCAFFTFPPISGTNLTGSQAYYSQSGGQGTSFSPGQTAASSGQYFIYDGTPGCEDEEAFTLNVIANLSIACNVITHATSNMVEDGSIRIIVDMGATPPFNVSWSGPESGSMTSNSSTIDITDLAPGTYNIAVEDADGCMDNCSEVINSLANCTMNVSTSITNASCPGENDGEINLLVTGATGFVVYDWEESTLDGMSNPTNLAPGNYTVTILDQAGCNEVVSAVITSNPGVDIQCQVINNISGPGAMDGTAELTIFGGTPPYTINYGGPLTGSFPAVQGANAFNNLPAGEFFIFVTDGNGCINECGFTISDCGLLVNLDITNVSCAGEGNGAITVNTSGGTSPYTYAWNDPTYDGMDTLTNLSSGLYIVTVTDDVNCVATGITSLEAPNVLEMSCNVVVPVSAPAAMEGVTDILISGGTAPYTLDVQGPTTINQVVNTAGIVTLNNLPSGFYTTTLTDANGCEVECSFFIELQPCGMTAAYSVPGPLCFGDSGQIQITLMNEVAPVVFDWSVDSLDGIQSPTGLLAGSYSLTIVDNTGCVIDTTLEILPSDLKIFCDVVAIESAPGVMDGEATVNINGLYPPFDVTWTGPVSGSQTANAPGLISIPGLTAGVYMIVVEDVNGCMEECSFVMNDSGCGATVFAVVTDATCPTSMDGSIDLDVQGGTPPFTFLWGDGEVTEDISNLGPGVYEVRIIDDMGCDFSATIPVGVITDAPTLAVIGNNEICEDDCITYNLQFTGASPYDLTYEVNSTGFSQTFNLVTVGTDTTLEICPDVLGIIADTFQVNFFILSDALCEDTVAISRTVNILPEPITTVDDGICIGDTVIVNGNVYDANNPTGMEVIAGGAVNGCDSIVVVALNIVTANVEDIVETLCPGESLTVNGTLYNEMNLVGSDTIPGGSMAGCDSIINVMISYFTIDTLDLTQTLCEGDSLEVNGTIYNEANPMGVEVIAGGATTGCDSVVVVDLSFNPLGNANLNPTLCPGASIIVNGSTYNEANPTGTEVITGGSANGCDSIVNISLSFFPADTVFINQQLCTGDSLVVNGVTYNETSPSGIEVIPAGTVNGCDSVISVMLTFGSASVNDIMATLCPGDSLVVNGITYNELNPLGMDTISNGSAVGCDSIINVMLTYETLDTVDLMQQLCTGDSLVVNGTVYNAANPSGIEIISNATVNGCDSAINIQLTFVDPSVNDIVQQLCPDQSLTVNGTLYDINNPMGADTIPNGALSGCDSIINVSLTFFTIDTLMIDSILCPGEILVVNGTTYDLNNPSGVEILPGGAANGCDSIITISLTYTFSDTGTQNDTLCVGESITVDGTVYDVNNPSGIEIINNGTVNGCDSIVSINLTFIDPAVTDVVETICVGDSIVINGVSYHASNTIGADTIPNGAANGCDSIINIMVDFYPVDTTFLNSQLCTGDSLIVNGTTYNAANPSGFEVITDGTVNGCDSLISINITFGDAAINTIAPTLCPGDSLIVNGITYNEINTMGSDTIPNGSIAGCDSIINVMLTFFTLDTIDLEQTLCIGDSIVINGTTYNESNPTGIEVLSGASANGCDSTINVIVTYLPQDTADFMQTLCPGDSLIFNGTTYNESNSTGIEVLPGASANGCDSVINVMVDFFLVDTVEFTTTICPSDSLIFNGTTYNAAMTSGIEVLSGASASGCDSIVAVSLNFFSIDTSDFTTTLCPGDSLIFNGTTYNAAMTSGIEVLPGASANGCDSVINVMVDFFSIDTFDFTTTLCPGDSLIFNGTTYNAAMPNGIEVLPGASANGCDSVINVMVDFFSIDTFDFTTTLCPGDSLIFNGTTYNAAMPNGIEILPGASANGCDSIINVMLNFEPLDTVQLTQQLCTGATLTVNGTEYSMTNPMGIEVIPNGTVNGCDSIINVMLTFGDAAINDVNQTLCSGDSLIFNGVTYNELNPMGSDTIVNGSVAGCDSIISVALTFFPQDTFDLTQTLCSGDSVVVNGTSYNEGNPSGLEIIPNGTINGCDSFVNVMLTFFPIDTLDISQNLCTGDSLIVNGTTYNAANPSGIEVIGNGTVNGCDSVINVMLTFGDASVNDVMATLCPGDSLIVNGITYNELNPMGSDTIPNGSIAGCDSIINVNLMFFPTDTFDIIQQLTPGDSLIVNGTTYNEGNPTGIEIIPNGTINGCDSIINIILTFGGEVVNNIVQTLCPGDSLIVNSITYNELNPIGSDTILNGSVMGLDSIINVSLTFFPADTLDIVQQLCTGDSLIVNGTTYNSTNPSGIELISNGTVNGCDSVINVMLTFGDASINDVVQTLCVGDSLILNGITYNELNPMGSDTIVSGSVAGCDSIINVALTFFPTDTLEIVQQLCTGDSLIVNGTTYNSTNPSGIELISNGTVNGCDSVINVMLTFGDASINDVVQTLCAGDSLILNGVTYNELNPMGSDTIVNGSVAGCDSIINVSLTFFPADTLDIVQQLCTGDSLIVNGTTYNAANPSGIELISNGTVNGCDSVINVMLTFGDASINDVVQTLCAGDSLILNGVTYNELNPMGSDTIVSGSVAGCDSIINVALTFFPTDTLEIVQQLCTGDSLIVNGTTYNATNPSGIELIANGTVNGCDSVINVMLTFGDASINDVVQTLCAGDSLILNGVTYNELNPMGSDTIVNGSVAGCDSIINVALTFFPADTLDIVQQLCTGDSLIVNGTTYNATNPGGIEVIANGTVNGCDSVINVNLTFGDASINDVVQTLCAGDSLILNGVTYNELNPMGSDTIVNGSVAGCDSIINVALTFFPADTLDIVQQLCTGDSLIVNGTTYNAANPSGIELISNGTVNGCDSVINVNLTFGDASINDVVQTLCAGDSLILNGVTYNELNPMGSDTIVNGSVAGCDSIINVALTFFPADTLDIVQQLCTGDSLIVNGTTYNATNPGGIELISNGTVNGCDSVINVMLTFGDASINDVVQTLCAGDSLILNGVTYNELNPMGSDTIVNGSVAGCDSIINVALTFFPADTLDIVQQLCTGDSLIVNGTTYNAANPSGIELISNGTVNGCDSIINVALTFFPADTLDIVQQLCTGDSLIVNGTTYNAANPSGIELIANGTVNGCDSVINVNLTFEMEVIEMITDTLCPGEFIEVNNVVYDEANPIGEEIIEGGSAGGCDSLIQVNLTYFEQASGFLSGSTSVCEGDSAFLTINLIGGPLFNVRISDGFNDVDYEDVTDGFTFGVLPSTTGTTTYSITLLTAVGSLCTVDIGAAATVTVEAAAVSVGVDTDYDGFGVSCADSEDAIVSATATGGASYLWNTGANSNQLMDVGPGTYIVTITTPAGCMAVDSAIVTAPPQLAVKISGISANCLDPINGSILFESLLGGTPPYEYSLDGVFFQSLNDLPATISNVEPGTYDLIIQDVNDCLVETTVNVGESEELLLELGEDEEIELGDSVLINPIALFDVDTFFWAPQEGLLDSVSFTTFASPSITTTYQLTAVDSLGCSVSDYITIIVNTQGSVYTPNVFSPNGDGRNDFFTIFAGNNVAEVTVFRIFDRWGNMVFESSPLQPNIETLGWDGNFNGEPMDPAVFVFYAEIQYVDGRTEVIKGDVTLIR